MGMLEDRFRRRFAPHPGGFRFVQWGVGVIFTADEVEDFVRNWRNSWASPRVWAIYAAAGIALPFYLLWTGDDGLALVAALIAAVAMTVFLYHAHREPNVVAERLVRTQAPDAARAHWPTRLLLIVLLGAMPARMVWNNGASGQGWAGILMLAGLAIVLFQEVREMLGRRR
ncbi:hypothetical protein [Sphingomonas sp. G-3-2-10]|uniref:hypothetical protein n=1 Tax=Sphingomonas sp. G-3-2-10 TaxID=2728838 RepID=UPI00146B0C4A|nr:hypothetical protein [Sphingomonas sp. G-3-2-10]NML06378.1 hypothetical protein [Sphingomonas sp. G-3-2-10]